MLTLDDDDFELVFMALKRVFNELDRQMRDGHTGGCSGGAYYASQYTRPRIGALIARIEQYQQDQKEEADDATA